MNNENGKPDEAPAPGGETTPAPAPAPAPEAQPATQEDPPAEKKDEVSS